MTDTPEPPGEIVTPQFKRGLAVAWVAIVVFVGACIFLGMWWNVSGVRREQLSTATAEGQVTETPPEQAALLTQAAISARASTTPPAALSLAGGTPGEGPAPTASPLPIADRRFGYGVVVNALDRPGEVLDRAQQLGVGWVRQPVRWADVEPEPGEQNWETLDAFFAEAAAHNLRVIVTVTAAPNWARSVTAGDRDGPPDNPAAYTAFISQLVQRYPGAIHAVEIWNEMNRERAWYAPGGLSASSYMELLIPAARAIRAADPGIIVVSGGLNPTGIDDGILAIDDFRYLRDLIDAGLLDYVDCVGAHHQGYNLPPTVPYDALEPDPLARFRQPYDNPHHSWSFYSTLRGYHDMIVAAGRDTPLCVTEFGWAAQGELPRAESMPAFVIDNTPEEQAAYAVQAFEQMREWEFVWFAALANLDLSLEETPAAEDDLRAYYGLLLPGGDPRPVFEAVREMPKEP